MCSDSKPKSAMEYLSLNILSLLNYVQMIIIYVVNINTLLYMLFLYYTIVVKYLYYICCTLYVVCFSLYNANFFDLSDITHNT